jgi:hypothetical protein
VVGKVDDSADSSVTVLGDTVNWIITEAVNARQIALKDSDHQFQLACDVQQKHM